MTTQPKLLEIKKPNIEAIKKGVNFDKDVYKKDILETITEDKAKEIESLKAITEDKAKETEEILTKEREMIKSWNFEISRENIANWNKERMELLSHCDFLVEQSIDSSERNLYKKVRSILEELAKNVQKDKYYTKDWENENYKKYETWEVKIISDDEKITITTSNYTKGNISRIPERLYKLNNMDEWQLKMEYKKALNEWEMSEKWWAGLWFIDIIKKSWGWKLECTIKETDIPEIKQIKFSISIPKDIISKKRSDIAA